MSQLPAPFVRWDEIDPSETTNPHVELRMLRGADALLFRVVVEAGEGAPLHYHRNLEQISTVIDGEMTITVGDQAHTLRAGDAVLIARGTPHKNYSETGATFFETFAPTHGGLPSDDYVLL